jgi:hypothetical protein
MLERSIYESQIEAPAGGEGSYQRAFKLPPSLALREALSGPTHLDHEGEKEPQYPNLKEIKE